MDVIFGKHMSRRTALKGLGATVALPFLDAMMPAGRLWASGKAYAPTDATRFVGIEMVHGAAGCNEWGASQYMCRLRRWAAISICRRAA